MDANVELDIFANRVLVSTAWRKFTPSDNNILRRESRDRLADTSREDIIVTLLVFAVQHAREVVDNFARPAVGVRTNRLSMVVGYFWPANGGARDREVE